MAVTFNWTGYVDTNLDFNEFFQADHTAMVRFMPQYPHAYFGPLLAENGSGTYLVGQGDFNIAPLGTRLFVNIGNQAPQPYRTPVRIFALTWQHIAIVRQGNQFLLYWNGTQLTPPVNLPGGELPCGRLRLGKRTLGRTIEGQDAQFYGMVDEFAVFTRALSQSDIQAMSMAPPLQGNEPGLLAAWRFLPDPPSGQNPRLSRPFSLHGDTYLAEVSPNRDAAADARLLPLPSNEIPMDLPFPLGESWTVIQGFDQFGGSHSGYASFCWDFGIADRPLNDPYPNGSRGAPFYAPAPGSVTAVRQSTPPPSPIVSPGGKNINYIVVQQETSQFYAALHLLKNTSQVKPGDQVGRAQRLGSTGGDESTQTNPHVHFAVANRPEYDRNLVTKEKPGFWTHRKAFGQVRRGPNIQLLSFSLVTANIPLRPLQ